MSMIDELGELLGTMEVPEFRRRITPENMKWLKRNLHINNRDHQALDKALEIVNKLDNAWSEKENND